MTNVTHRIMTKDSTLKLYQEGKWNEGVLVDPYSGDPGEFTSFNDAGVETETGEFLYAMVRLLKPEHVLETGTHWGVGSAYMGQALADNKKGDLDTIEFLPEIRARAQARFHDLGLDNIIHSHFGDARAFEPGDRTYGLILLDTEPQTRFGELVRYFEYLEPGGYVFIHDLHRHMGQVGQNPDHPNEPKWPWGPIPADMASLVTEGKLRPMHFPTPRGLTGFYKPHPGDYQWQ